MLSHDAFGKLIFRVPEYFAAFAGDHLPAALAAEIDPDRPVELLDGGFIDESLRQYQCDVVYRIPLKSGADHCCYVPIENKSSPDPGIYAQLAHYRAAIWEHYAVNGRLPLVFPLVVYNGRRKWRLPLQAAEQLQDCGPATALVRESARLSHGLVDLPRLGFDALCSNLECRALVGALRGDPGPQEHRAVLSRIAEMLPDRYTLAKGALSYVYSQWDWGAYPFFEEQVQRVRDAKGARTMITMAQVHQGEIESMAQVHQGEIKSMAQVHQDEIESMSQVHQQEIEENAAEVRAEMVLNLMRHRHKDLPEWAVARVTGASAEELNLWAERMLDTESLEDVFA